MAGASIESSATASRKDRARPASRAGDAGILTRRQALASGAILALFGRKPSAASDRAPLPSPQDPVILTVTGAIGRTNAPGRAEFDLATLEGLGLRGLATWTPWTDGEVRFEGVLARRLLAALDAHGSEVIGGALNDYKTAIPIEDFHTYDVLLATRMNHEALRIRDKGPIWVVYPWSDHPELDDKVTRRKSVWQLNHLHVR